MMKGMIFIKTHITSTNLSNLSENHDFKLEIPSQCPCCHTALSPVFLDSFYIAKNSYSSSECGELFSLYFCPKCEKCFLAHYKVDILGYRYQSTGTLTHLTPYGSEKTAFSNKIVSLSPSFVEIYHQAEKAENIGLSEICGLGYRKALEFLVKDYAIAFNPDDSDAIKSKMLSPCITDYIDNKRIKSLATASAWIGNDETHYLRKHEDYNLNHLKAFISAIVSYIDSELSYLEAEALLNKPKK